MKFFIDHKALERLTDEKLEIRQNALKEVAEVFYNNILIERGMHKYRQQSQEDFRVVNLEALTRQLIRWFKFRPVTNEQEVFDLLIMIFSREDFLRYITKTLSLERLRKEMAKIGRILIPEESSEMLRKIEDLLNQFEQQILVDIADETGSFLDVKSTVYTPSPVDNSLVERLRNVCLSPTPSTGSNCDDEDGDVECVNYEFWENLQGDNLETFNFIDNELVNYGDKTRLKTILKFLKVSLYDFPPEFMLQPPNVLETLIDILPKVGMESKVDILRLIHFTVNGLKSRLIEAQKQDTKYIPIKRHMNKICQMFTNYFERFHDNFAGMSIKHEQETLNCVYEILFDMVELVEQTEDICDIYINELLNMLAKVIRDFRVGFDTSEANFEYYRLNYIVGIFLVNAFVSRINVEYIVQYSQNNLWEYESDLALLDWSLQNTHTNIYKLLKKNRESAIEYDQDMKLLLNAQAFWKPVVELFQGWESLGDELIIYKGSKCLDTIRIHKSLELVDLLFKTILRCAEKFKKIDQLRKSAEDIVLRLLSVDVPEIRLKAYSMARQFVQQKLTDDQDENLKDADLCAVLGIPINTEIVTEVLCFGCCDSNEEIHQHAKLILFALLRSKVVFPNHWAKILETMRPVLPLVPCLFKMDPKLGFFSIDIFHEHTGFEVHELNQAFTRFLYCTSPKAREIAKIKLLENLGAPEYTSDFIEIVPDDFCIISESQVSELQMPDKNIQFDVENYEAVKNILAALPPNEPDILQSVLLQLSVQMNAWDLCIKSHDDHLWVHFIPNLEMGYPKNSIIRKLTVNILYKWAVTNSGFRIYLSSLLQMWQFLINTLIYYQDDPQIKLHTTSLLFLLAFSDFVVMRDRIISLPMFVNQLKCPFKFEQHWTESPFNIITQLEWVYEALAVHSDHMDVQEITLRYLKCTFASAWFKSPKHVYCESVDCEERYFKNLSNNTLKFSEKLYLEPKDIKLLNGTKINRMITHIFKHLEGTVATKDLFISHQETICLMMLPNVNPYQFAEYLFKKIKIFSQGAENPSEYKKYVLNRNLEMYERLVPSLSNEKILEMINRKPIIGAFGKCEIPDEHKYVLVLKIIEKIVKECKTRKDLADHVIKSFNTAHKMHFPTALIEKLCDRLFDYNMKDTNWNDATKITSVKAILSLMRNILRSMTVELDEKYVNDVFTKLIKISKEFLRSKRTKSLFNNHVVSQIFGIVDTLTSLNYEFKLQKSHYSILFLWIKENEKVDKAIIWSIIGNLTRKKESFKKFCEDFKLELSFSVFDMLMERIFDRSQKSIYEQKALAILIGNFLDYGNRRNHLSVEPDKQYVKLVTRFFEQPLRSSEIVTYVVKKMIQNKIPETVKIIKRKKLLENVLKSSFYNLDIFNICYSHEDLKEYANDVICNIDNKRMADLINRLEHPSNSYKGSTWQTRVNQNILNILLILMESSSGIELLHRTLRIPSLFMSLAIVVYCGLNGSNQPEEIIFHIKFLNSLLNAHLMIKSDISASIFGNYESEIIKSEKFLKIPKDMRTMIGMFSQEMFNTNLKKARYGCDLFLLQALVVFNYAEYSKASGDAKYEMILSAFVFIRNLLAQSTRAQEYANEIQLQDWLVQKTDKFLKNPNNFPQVSYAEASKKLGVQKCLSIVRNMCIYLKAITEWNLLKTKDHSLLKDLFDELKKIYLWIESDSVLSNCFLQYIQYISTTTIIKPCIMQEINGNQFLKGLVKKVQLMTAKTPHTETGLMLIRNGLSTIEKCSHMIDVRLSLKNLKVFQILEQLHPQIQANKRTTWNEVTNMWLKFFEDLSRYEDCECTPGQISLLCRIFRIGTPKMKSLALKIIRNLSMKSTLGYVVIISDDFMQTIESILLGEGSNFEKLLILQTLLSAASKSEQSRSKLKNSSFNRKLKEHLVAMEMVLEHTNDTEIVQLFNLTSMLKDTLYA